MCGRNTGRGHELTKPEQALGPGVTAVIVTHNSAVHLSSLAGALQAGSLAPVRALVVDNASSDDTLARAHEAGLEVHASASNAGFGAACNIALTLTETEFLLICNPDVRPSLEALEQLLGALAENPTAAIAGSPGDRPLHARRFSRIAGNVWGFLPTALQRLTMRLSPEVEVDPDEHPVVDYVVGAFMLCRVAALRSVGGFDARFFLYCEEEDLSRRLGEAGRQTLLVNSAIVEHEDRSSSEGVARATMSAFYFHSLYLYYRKHHTRLYAELARAVLAACVLFDRGYRGLAGKEQVYDAGTAWAPFLDIALLRQKLPQAPEGATDSA
jgi:N-acetylglucosaminyl-diphospho-decaprenol L-rhamnosyltransferase